MIFWPFDKLGAISPRFLCSVENLESQGLLGTLSFPLAG